jgi:tRNA (guanine37-N1)-methyltransferase
LRKRLREKLSEAMPREELQQIYDSFDIIGDIAIFKVAKENTISIEVVAKQIMAVHRSVKIVFVQTSPVSGDFRVRELKLVAGENKTVTKYKEAGCIFGVDVEKCYFSPRLSGERRRIASLIKNGEIVVNMFSGVGCFSILIGKTSDNTKVYSIDVNPTAFSFMEDNVRINRLYNRVIPLLGDSKDIIQNRLQGLADRVLMPLPELALKYLPYAIMALKPSGGWIHYYDFQHAVGKENPEEKTKLKVAQKLDSLGVCYDFGSSRIIRNTGPNWFQTVLDIQMFQSPSKF